MDLVDEQDVTLFELGEDRREITGALECWPRRDVQVHAHLDRNDAGHRCLAQPGWTCEQDVVGWLATLLGCLEHDRQVLFELALTDELRQPFRTKPDVVDVVGLVDRARVDGARIDGAWCIL